MAKSPKSSKAEQRVFAASSTQVLESLRAAKREWSHRLLVSMVSPSERVHAFTTAVSPQPEYNVVGVGIGEKVVGGQSTGIRALKFLVRIKFPPSQLSAGQLLPRHVNGLPVDVEEVGFFQRFPRKKPAGKGKTKEKAMAMPDPRRKIRPAQPGCSIGYRDPANQFLMAGTFGALVEDETDSYVLSNNHVLADEGRLPIGSLIFQPGLLDGGKINTDQIAELSRFEPLQIGVLNQVDCALARPIKTSWVSDNILYIGPPQGVGRAAMDMVVHKFGRTTGYRVGRVISTDTDVAVQYETGRYTFESQILIVGLQGQAFSDTGDSGSLILERETQLGVGLLFAGSASHTIANHLENVFQTMNVKFV